MLIFCYIKYSNEYFKNEATKLFEFFLMTRNTKSRKFTDEY